MKLLLVSTALLVALFNAVTFAAAATADGYWLLSNGKLTVRVTYCGGTKLCGSISSLERTLNEDGTEKLDFKNPNASMRSRRVIGSTVFNGLVPAGENRWKGKIYSADDGGTYRAIATLKGNAFEVKGCWLMFCKDLNFSRIK
jgi:uncharacterized protein (DUF2147 family)